MHSWTFFRAGGFDQVSLDSGADLLALAELDQKLWVALSCPTSGLEFDARTLQLVDADGDGRIRAPEILAAVRWATSVVRDPGSFTRSSPSLPLSLIDDGKPDGKRILASARQILKDLGKPAADAITVDDTTDTARIFASTRFNGDGVVPPEAADDPAVAAVLADILATVGGEPDRSGKPGASKAKADAFFAACAAFSDWWAKAESDPAILPLGPATAGAYAALDAVRAKVEDYFTRCRLAGFDARAAAALNRTEADFAALASRELSSGSSEIAGFPLARVEAGRPLPLADGLNPAWAAAVAKLRADVVAPILGARDTLSEAEWGEVVARLAPYGAWAAGAPGGAGEKLGLARVREILASGARDAIDALVAQDRSLEAEASAIAEVDRLVRYHRDLYTLLNNFVSFRDFYGRRKKAVFQAGTLYLDQRSCDLCVRVADPGRHAALAGLSRMYLAYCDLTRRGTGEKMTIAAAFTDGDADNLLVGRNGVFYDREGRDWDATITRIVDNPISVRQAFWAPYKKAVRMVEEQIEKFATAKAAAVEAVSAETASGSVTALHTPPPAEKTPAFDVAKFAGIFAAIGLAIGAIGGAIGAMLSAFVSLAWWQMPLAVGGILLVVSGPSMLIASLKLRRRNLGPLLDASGWAVNANALVNIPFGASLTNVAALPLGARRSVKDAFRETHGRRNLAIAAGTLLVAGVSLWYAGVVTRVFPSVPTPQSLTQAPAPPPPPPPVEPPQKTVAAP